MANVAAVLKRKVGPLPVGGWLAAGAGGVLIGRKLLARRSSSSEGGPVVVTAGDSIDPYDALPLDTASTALPVDVTGRDPEAEDPSAAYGGGFDPLPTPDTGEGGAVKYCIGPDGVRIVKTYPDLPCRDQPGATPPTSKPRRCPTGYHWNGFACVANKG